MVWNIVYIDWTDLLLQNGSKAHGIKGISL